MRAIIVLMVCAGIMMNVHAQKGVEDGSKYGKGQDSINCVRNLSVYREYVKQKVLKDALPGWRAVFTECPKASKNIYIDGVRIMSFYIDKEKDATLKEKYIDTLLLIYDQRIQYFGEKGNVLGRKGMDIMKYRSGNIDAVQLAFDCLTESVKLEKNKSASAIIASLVSAMSILYKANRIDEAKVVETYAMASDILDQVQDESASMARQHIDQVFSTLGVSCSSLVSLFGKRFDAASQDSNLLKIITSVFASNKCEDEEVYYNACENLYALNPSAKTASLIANLAKKRDDYEKAVKYYLNAVELETENKEKVNYYLQLSDISYRKLNNYAAARTYAIKAFELDNTNGRAMMLIGNIYATAKNCEANELQKKAIYWLAVDYYRKAKEVDVSLTEEANQNISVYSAYFPDKETIFFHGLEEGQKYTVECWINEPTIVRARK